MYRDGCIQRDSRDAEHKSCSLLGRMGRVTRRALTEFAARNPAGGFVSGCSEHASLMFLGCFQSSPGQSWFPLP